MTGSTGGGTRTVVLDDGLPRRRMRTYTLSVRTPAATRTLPVREPLVRIGSRPENDLVLEDDAVSRLHATLEADEHGFRLRDQGSRNGTFVDGVRALDVYLRPGAEIRLGASVLVFTPSEDECDVPASPADRFGPLVGAAPKMRELYAVLDRVAPTSATVLVEGETGTGKELVAQAIHERSPRSGGPLVVVDCGSVPAELLESELFGHAKGAFTDAVTERVGRFEEAHGGTLFLDELGELPLELQPKLLRAIEQREIRRVGSSRVFHTDIRIVAATHRDLAREVNRGSFREDLYYRLAVIRVELPPLRERRDDIPLLVRHFVRRMHAGDPARAARILEGLREDTWRKLRAHPWPGNVRELRNVIERTLALAGDGAAQTAHLGLDAQAGARRRAGPAVPASAVDLDAAFVDQKATVLAAFEQAYLTAQLDRHGGNISRAASASGLDRMYFKRLLKKYR